MKAVNLLPPDLRSGPVAAPVIAGGGDAAGSGPGAFLVLGALALAVVAMAVHVLGANTVKSRTAELAAVTARTQVVAAQTAALKRYADYDAIAKARIETVRDLVGQRFAWDRALRDLARAVPADVTLSELDATVSSAAGAVGAGGIRGALDVPAVELKGCTAGQTDVARLMSRLGTVTGVTRVSLASSDKDQPTQRSQGAGAAPAAAAGAGETDACGKGEHPTFDVIAFFERDASAATAASPSATPTAGTTLTPGASTTGAPTATTTSATEAGK
jgi:Tfp pilus assembly protein PilN